MNNYEKEAEILKNTRLSDASRERIGRELLSYARFHAIDEDVRDGAVGRSMGEATGFASFITRLTTRSTMFASVLIGLVLTGGAAYASEGSVPGDVLYPFKTTVTEGVRGALAFGAQAEGEYHAALMAERLEESAQLASRGELDAVTAAALAAEAKAEYQRALDARARAEAEGDAEATIAIDTALSKATRDASALIDTIDTSVNPNVDANVETPLLNASATLKAATSSVIAPIRDVINALPLEMRATATSKTETTTGSNTDTSINDGVSDTHETSAKTKVEAGIDVDTTPIDVHIDTEVSLDL